MALSRGTKIGILLGVLGPLVGIAIGLGVVAWSLWPAAPREPFTVRLDPAGPYVILASQRAARAFDPAIARAKELHPTAAQSTFDPDHLDELRATLREKQPRYALVFLMPDELDVNFAWRWLTMTSQLDDDPFVDVRTGFITGDSPEAADAFVGRIVSAAAGGLQLPGSFVDNLGPNEQAAAQQFVKRPGSWMIPVLGARCRMHSLSHGKQGFTEDRLESMSGAGLLHFGGHGHPERVDDGATGAQAGRLKLDPCVVFNGACYTGVTHRWFDQMGPTVTEQTVKPEDCFCLQLLRNQVVGYLAAIHPDHGMPVYQEMEYLAHSGAPLGAVIKYTYDGIVVGGGGRLPEFEQLKGGMKPQAWTPKDVMLKGTAARILFGDPALVVSDSFTPPPFSITVAEDAAGLRITAVLQNPKLTSTFTDTYQNDLNLQAPFNDRALLVADLPQGWETVKDVEVIRVVAGGKALSSKLIGFAVERDQGVMRLHVQVDVPATGFQQSPLRTAGATVELIARRADR
jgi:hypothetical protein